MGVASDRRVRAGEPPAIRFLSRRNPVVIYQFVSISRTEAASSVQWGYERKCPGWWSTRGVASKPLGGFSRHVWIESPETKRSRKRNASKPDYPSRRALSTRNSSRTSSASRRALRWGGRVSDEVAERPKVSELTDEELAELEPEDLREFDRRDLEAFDFSRLPDSALPGEHRCPRCHWPVFTKTVLGPGEVSLGPCGCRVGGVEW